jgi:hypothetical protein
VEHQITNILALAMLFSLATYFIFESAQAAAPAHPDRGRDMVAVVAAALIAVLLITVAVVLLDPTRYGAAQPSPWLKRQWLLPGPF